MFNTARLISSSCSIANLRTVCACGKIYFKTFQGRFHLCLKWLRGMKNLAALSDHKHPTDSTSLCSPYWKSGHIRSKVIVVLGYIPWKWKILIQSVIHVLHQTCDDAFTWAIWRTDTDPYMKSDLFAALLFFLLPHGQQNLAHVGACHAGH